MKYNIKCGNHYPSKALLPRAFFCKSSFEWKITFSKECWYEKGISVDFFDLNKLTGVLFGLRKLYGSFRFAWVPNFDKPGIINVYAYSYESLHRTKFPDMRFLIEVPVEKSFQCSIHVFPSIMESGKKVIGLKAKYTDLLFEDSKIEIFDQVTSCRSGIIHRPYHGGNLTAPNDYSITVDLVKME